jgi:hypothetical protein
VEEARRGVGRKMTTATIDIVDARERTNNFVNVASAWTKTTTKKVIDIAATAAG